RLKQIERHVRSTRVSTAGTALQSVIDHLRSPTSASCTDILCLGAVDAEQMLPAWLHYAIHRPFNAWTVLPALGIRRIALFGGGEWGRVRSGELLSAGVECVAIIENDARRRHAPLVPLVHCSLLEFVASGPAADAVLSSLWGDHDRRLLPQIQET